MIPQRNSLPLPPDAFVPGLTEMPRQDVEHLRDEMIRERDVRALDLGRLDARIHFVLLNLCIPGKSVDVEQYKDGDLPGISRKFVDDHQRPVGQLQWLDLSTRLAGPGDSPGNVSQQRWTSGALIARNLFLTAGHSFRPHDWTLPTRNNVTLTPPEMAALMKVNFNYELPPNGTQPQQDQSFPVVALRELFKNGVDYAILELGPDAGGRWPGDVFGTLKVATQDLTAGNARLCLIHHPNRNPKRVDGGPMVNNAGGTVFYRINATPGSSGAPIIAVDTGEIVGIHRQGGCMNGNGANQGQAIGAIRAASTLL